MENNARADGFPAGLRVLVVDDDPTWLKILEKMLRKCSYEVTTCGLARVALDMLREKRDRFDIVISDVNMPDMDGFKLLEHVGLEMDLPVIMMSVDGETSRVMKGVQHGACDYLLKPVRMKELKNIWQHVFRKRINEIRDVEYSNGVEDFQIIRHKFSCLDGRRVSCGSDSSFPRKRKDATGKELADHDLVDSSSLKKARVVWSVDLHQKFVNAVNQIGFEKVGPKKILDLMNVHGLTRENVASHLQKYRLYLSRLQKQNEVVVASGGVMQPEFGSKDHMKHIGFQIPPGPPRKDSNLRMSDKSSFLNGVSPKFMSREAQAEDKKMPLANCNVATQHQKTSIYLDSLHFAKGLTQTAEHKMQTSAYIMDNDGWNRGIATMQIGKHPGKEQNLFSSEFQPIHQLGEKDAGDHLSTFISPATSWAESFSTNTKPVVTEFGSDPTASSLPMAEYATNLVSIKMEPQDRSCMPIPFVPEINVCSTQSCFPERYLIEKVDRAPVEGGSVYPSSKDAVGPIQNHNPLEDLGFAHMDFLRYNSLTPEVDLPDSMYEGSQLDYEHNFDWIGFPNSEGGLFT